MPAAAAARIQGLSTNTTSSPPDTASAPPPQKSFWTSTMTRASPGLRFCSMFLMFSPPTYRYGLLLPDLARHIPLPPGQRIADPHRIRRIGRFHGTDTFRQYGDVPRGPGTDLRQIGRDRVRPLPLFHDTGQQRPA